MGYNFKCVEDVCPPPPALSDAHIVGQSWRKNWPMLHLPYSRSYPGSSAVWSDGDTSI